MSAPTVESDTQIEVISFQSRHSAFLEMSLSRYKRKWFLTYPRMYGMTTPPGQRIVCALNVPDPSMPEEHAKRHFWLNPTTGNTPYKPDDPAYASQKYIGSPIHLLLDSEPSVARLTGRTRAEQSQAPNERGKEIACFEIEVTMGEEGLLRQCYYCLDWEASEPMERFKPCGDDIFWCPACESKGWTLSAIKGTSEKLRRDTWLPLMDNSCFPRDNLYI